MKIATRSNAILLLAYLAALALVTLGMFAARNWALSTFDTAENQADWQAWRERTRQLSAEPGPVARRAAKSSEPPTIVLLRDYFATCLVALLLLSSVLFATLAFMVRGVASGPKFEVELEDETQDEPP